MAQTRCERPEARAGADAAVMPIRARPGERHGWEKMTAMASIVDRLRARKEWQFFAALPRADSALALTWYAVLVLRGVLPAAFALSMGLLVAAVQRGGGLRRVR